VKFGAQTHFAAATTRPALSVELLGGITRHLVYSPTPSTPGEATTTTSRSNFIQMAGEGAPPSDNLTRTVNILGPNPTAANNEIRTSLYTWYTFPTVRLAAAALTRAVSPPML
jgi:hypothetical protein